MSPGRSIHLWLFAAATLLASAPSVLAAKSLPGQWTTNHNESVACQRQLNIIYGAIQEYQKRENKLPRWLSDLLPRYIHDPNVLVCPFVINTGNLKKYREEYLAGVFGDPGSCTYAYEFCTAPFHWIPGWTARDYKKRQMELIGFAVPIVRCFAHRPVLNLGFDGSIYGSLGEWEDNFAVTDKHHSAFHSFRALTNRSRNELIQSIIEPRSAQADARLLDLSAQYNALLVHLSQIDPSGKLLVTYPTGLQKIGGIDFDIRALIHLTGKDFPVSFPDAASNIVVQRRCAVIHFLHGVMFEAPAGDKVASYIIHREDGSFADVPLRYGTEVATRWFDPQRVSAAPSPTPAWVTPREQLGPTARALRLYVTSWQNSAPTSRIKSIDFVSHMTTSAPFLIAVTVEWATAN